MAGRPKPHPGRVHIVKKAAALLIKLAVTLTLLYFAVSRIDLHSVVERLQNLHAIWFVGAIILVGTQVVLAAERWRRIVDLCGARLSRDQAVRYSFMSLFFGQVLPSTIGGDAARIWFVGRDGAGWAKAVYSVIIDRLAGLLALALIVLVSIPASFALISDPVARGSLLLLGLGSFLAPALFVAAGRWQWRALHRIGPLRHAIAAAILAFSILAKPRNAFRIGLLSLVIHGLLILTAWLVAKSITAPLDFLHALVLIPPIILIATVPISVAGWGVRESAAVMAFGYAGLPPDDGLLVSTLLGAAIFVAGLPGGFLWIIAQWGKAAPLATLDDLPAR